MTIAEVKELTPEQVHPILAVWLQRDGNWQEEWLKVYQYLDAFWNPQGTKTVGERISDASTCRGFDGQFLERRPPSEATKNDWREQAVNGQPTSASPPLEVTPICKAPYLEVPKSTPEKVPNPLKKVALAAEKKLQQKLANMGPGCEPEGVKPFEQKKDASSKRKKLNPDEAMQPQSKPKKDMSNGPMQEAMQRYFQKGKDKGMSYNEIRKQWKCSKARAKIIASMPSPERRKRRFE